MNSVKEFVLGTGGEVPTQATSLDKKRVIFLSKMVVSEMIELLQTVMSGDEAKQIIIEGVNTDFRETNIPEFEEEIIAGQADAMIDAMYYMYDSSLRYGINLDKFFDEVHNANMNKRFPDGTFHKREDSKIIKPDGWQEPNVINVALNQMFNNEL